MMHSKMKWLILIQLLMTEQALCRVTSPPSLKNRPLLGTYILEEEDSVKQGEQLVLGPQNQLSLPSGAGDVVLPGEDVVQGEGRVQHAQRIVTALTAKLQGPMKGRIVLQGNASCEELLSASTLEDPSSGLFPRELLGLSLVPVLVAAGCPLEAQVLVLRLYDLLGMEDTEELLAELEDLMERGTSRPRATASPHPSSVEKVQAERHLQAVMFNIQQLARAGEGERGQEASEKGRQGEQCQGWTRVNGTLLLGEVVEGAVGGLEEAVRVCENLGSRCAGVARGGGALNHPGWYRTVLKTGSRVMPSENLDSECWLRQCEEEEAVEEDPSFPSSAASGRRRARRSPQRNCVNKREERVYSVVEWIPAVSTLYNLGTAVYYASVNCTETAKERAILSAVDLGTDALMAVTGGTAGVAGYALGAGVKTGVKAGVKYLLSSMKQEDDLMVNQYSWEEGTFTIQ